MGIINAYAAKKAGADLEAFQYEIDAIGPHDVEIDVAYCGICHSDLSMINNEWGMSQYPLVAGHEVAGRISAVGSEVTHLEVGQSVGLGWHSDYCHQCGSCDTGDHNLCASATGTIVGRHGGFGDKVVANAKSVVPLPTGMDLKTAGPLFCGGITVFNPLVQYGVKPTDKVAVIGIGGLGHLALQFLNAWGCEVTAFTSNSAKSSEAVKLGAHHCINSRDASEIEAAVGSFDMIISTVNVTLDWNLYLSTLKPKGRLHFVGATLDPLNVGVFSMLGGQKQISASPVGSPATIAMMLEFAHQHDIKPQIELFPFSKINEALKHLESGQARYRIVLEQGS